MSARRARIEVNMSHCCHLPFETEEVESLTSRRHNKLLQAKLSVRSAVLVVKLCSALVRNSKAFAFVV